MIEIKVNNSRTNDKECYVHMKASNVCKRTSKHDADKIIITLRRMFQNEKFRYQYE